MPLGASDFAEQNEGYFEMTASIAFSIGISSDTFAMARAITSSTASAVTPLE